MEDSYSLKTLQSPITWRSTFIESLLSWCFQAYQYSMFDRTESPEKPVFKNIQLVRLQVWTKTQYELNMKIIILCSSSTQNLKKNLLQESCLSQYTEILFTSVFNFYSKLKLLNMSRRQWRPHCRLRWRTSLSSAVASSAQILSQWLRPFQQAGGPRGAYTVYTMTPQLYLY